MSFNSQSCRLDFGWVLHYPVRILDRTQNRGFCHSGNSLLAVDSRSRRLRFSRNVEFRQSIVKWEYTLRRRILLVKALPYFSRIQMRMVRKSSHMQQTSYPITIESRRVNGTECVMRSRQHRSLDSSEVVDEALAHTLYYGYRRQAGVASKKATYIGSAFRITAYLTPGATGRI